MFFPRNVALKFGLHGPPKQQGRIILILATELNRTIQKLEYIRMGDKDQGKTSALATENALHPSSSLSLIWFPLEISQAHSCKYCVTCIERYFYSLDYSFLFSFAPITLKMVAGIKRLCYIEERLCNSSYPSKCGGLTDIWKYGLKRKLW